jgi:hypothetical protein
MYYPLTLCNKIVSSSQEQFRYEALDLTHRMCCYNDKFSQLQNNISTCSKIIKSNITSRFIPYERSNLPFQIKGIIYVE